MRTAAGRISALLTLIALLTAAMSLASTPAGSTTAGLDAAPERDAVAGLLVPRNVRLIIEYKRTAIA